MTFAAIERGRENATPLDAFSGRNGAVAARLEREAAVGSGGVVEPASSAVESRATLITGRLVLRPFTLEDAPHVQRLAGVREVADTTLNIPHPYEDGMAEAWIQTHAEAFATGRERIFAVIRRNGTILIGAIGLRLALAHGRAEMGYWIGVPYWNQGYCTEAAEAVLRHGFEELGLHRIHATHLARNPASGRVMQKIGMSYEGSLRGHVKKAGVFEDIEAYGILAAEWRARVRRKRT